VKPLSIVPAAAAGREWAACLMASTEPWITLGRGLEDCRARCLHPEYEMLVASRGGELCGFVLLHPRGLAGSPYIASIATAAEVRGQGVGSALLDAAERFFPGARHLFLCVSSFNAGARAWYQRRGYAAVGELRDYAIPGASEIVLHKRLEHL